MSVLVIRRWPDPVLRRVCAPVGGQDVSSLAADMLETMYAAPGRGLAAPQVGEAIRLFVMDVAWKDGAPEPWVFVDPEVVGVSDEVATREEGCLSIPGIVAGVTRPARVTVRWTGPDGRVREEAFDGFAAACVQHEMDHLDGIVTFDRVDATTRARLLAEYAA